MGREDACIYSIKTCTYNMYVKSISLICDIFLIQSVLFILIIFIDLIGTKKKKPYG